MNLLLVIWRKLGVRAKWRLLWWLHPKFNVAVHGIVQNDAGQVLLVKHRFWPQQAWGCPGGFAQRGETLAQTLAREMAEETGLKANMVSLVDIESGYRLRYAILVSGVIVPPVNIKLDAKEILDARFFSLHELPDNLLPSHRDYLQNWQSQQ